MRRCNLIHKLNVFRCHLHQELDFFANHSIEINQKFPIFNSRWNMNESKLAHHSRWNSNNLNFNTKTKIFIFQKLKSDKTRSVTNFEFVVVFVFFHLFIRTNQWMYVSIHYANAHNLNCPIWNDVVGWICKTICRFHSKNYIYHFSNWSFVWLNEISLKINDAKSHSKLTNKQTNKHISICARITYGRTYHTATSKKRWIKRKEKQRV